MVGSITVHDTPPVTGTAGVLRTHLRRESSNALRYLSEPTSEKKVTRNSLSLATMLEVAVEDGRNATPRCKFLVRTH